MKVTSLRKFVRGLTESIHDYTKPWMYFNATPGVLDEFFRFLCEHPLIEELREKQDELAWAVYCLDVSIHPGLNWKFEEWKGGRKGEHYYTHLLYSLFVMYAVQRSTKEFATLTAEQFTKYAKANYRRIYKAMKAVEAAKAEQGAQNDED